MKPLAVRLFVLLGLMIPLVARAATPAQIAAVDAWKAEFPAAAPADSANLKTFIAGYQQAVSRVTAGAAKTVTLLRDKYTRDLAMTNNVLHPPKPNPKITPAMRVDAEEASQWLNGKFAPYLAKAPK